MEIGDSVEDFTLEDQFGAKRSLSEFLATGPVVLFFYPMAMTKGCTAESCHFRDLAKEYQELGAHRIGISADSVDRQAQFSEMHAFDYPLLSDPNKVVANQFGVKRIGRLPSRRQTFVISQDAKILGVIKSEVAMSRHGNDALALLRAQPTSDGA